MLWLVAAALTAASPPPSPVEPVVQARATVRILTAVRLRATGPQDPDVPAARTRLVSTRDGGAQPVRMIEFE